MEKYAQISSQIVN